MLNWQQNRKTLCEVRDEISRSIDCMDGALKRLEDVPAMDTTDSGELAIAANALLDRIKDLIGEVTRKTTKDPYTD